MKYTITQIQKAQMMADLAVSLNKLGINDIDGFVKEVNGIEEDAEVDDTSKAPKALWNKSK